MSGYEEEHNIPKSDFAKPPRRPDLSTFFSTLELVNTPENNPNARAEPSNISSLFTQLANSYQVMQGETEGVAIDHAGERQTIENPVLENLIYFLMANAEHPPEKIDGVPDTFFAGLERIPKKDLKAHQSCPICSNPFLEDEYPLVIRLPCHKSHLFDLECIEPWLKLNRTCPLDRIDLVPKKKPPKPPIHDEEDGEWDEMFA